MSIDVFGPAEASGCVLTLHPGGETTSPRGNWVFYPTPAYDPNAVGSASFGVTVTVDQTTGRAVASGYVELAPGDPSFTQKVDMEGVVNPLELSNGCPTRPIDWPDIIFYQGSLTVSAPAPSVMTAENQAYEVAGTDPTNEWVVDELMQGQPTLTSSADLAAVQTHDPSLESYVDPLEVVLDTAAVAEEAAQYFGVRYAGSVIDRSSPPGMLRLLAVAPSERDRVEVARIAQGSPLVTLEAAPYMRASLLRWRDAAIAVLQDHGIADFMAGIDEVRGYVTIKSKPLPNKVEEALRDTLPADVIRITAAPDFATRLLHRNRDYFTTSGKAGDITFGYEAGLYVEATRACTSGFTIVQGGNYYGTTAGHCGNPGTPVKNRTTTLSNMGLNGFTATTQSTADVGRYFIANKYRTGRILVNEATQFRGSHRNVSLSFADSGLGLGRRLCIQGYESGNNNCGPLNDTNEALSHSGKLITNLMCRADEKVQIQEGDSGGPVYNVRRDGTANAAGWVVHDTLINGRQSSCFTSVQRGLTKLGSGALIVREATLFPQNVP